MNTPITKDSRGRMRVSRYRFGQIRKSRNAKQITKIMRHLMNAQESISAREAARQIQSAGLVLLTHYPGEEPLLRWVEQMQQRVKEWAAGQLFLID